LTLSTQHQSLRAYKNISILEGTRLIVSGPDACKLAAAALEAVAAVVKLTVFNTYSSVATVSMASLAET
jgi:hypothetical protein